LDFLPRPKYDNGMTVVRVALFMLLSLMLDVVVPVALASEEAVHRPRSHARVRLARNIPAFRVAEQFQAPNRQLPSDDRPLLRVCSSVMCNPKTPQPESDPPPSPDDY